MRKKRIVICERCHKEKIHFSKGMCRSCYGTVLTASKKVDCEVCGRKNMPYAGIKICRNCVTKKSKDKHNSKEKKEVRAIKERERRKKNHQEYLAKERERNQRPERKEQRRNSTLVWQRNNKDYLRAYRKEYRSNKNPDAVKTWEQNRRARHASAGFLSREEWEMILDKYNHSCYYCGKSGVRLEQEHKTPLVRGGKHNVDNVVPACRECNSSKYTKTEEEYLERIKNHS